MSALQNGVDDSKPPTLSLSKGFHEIVEPQLCFDETHSILCAT